MTKHHAVKHARQVNRRLVDCKRRRDFLSVCHLQIMRDLWLTEARRAQA